VNFNRTRTAAGLLAAAVVAGGVLWPAPASAHTDPVSVTPANGSVVAGATALVVTYPEPVSVYTVTVTNGVSRQTTRVGRKSTTLRVPLQVTRGAWVASWDTLMPDGDRVTQATTFRVGKLAGVPRPATRSVSSGGATLTVAASDSRAGAPTRLALKVAGGRALSCALRTAGVDVPLPTAGGRVVLVASSSVTCMVLTPAGTVPALTVAL
jgi:methionine-rich copper-binding protein CopC